MFLAAKNFKTEHPLIIKSVCSIGVAILILLVVAGSFFLGSRLVSSSEADTDLGQVSFQFYPSWGGKIDGYVPIANWGVRFKRFWLPLTVKVELRTLNRERMLDVAEGDERVITSAQEDLKNGFQASLARVLIYSFLVLNLLLICSYPLWKNIPRKWIIPTVAFGVFLLISISIGVVLQAETKNNLLENPTFYASGSELQQILRVVDEAEVDSIYGSEFSSIIRSVSSLLATGKAPADEENSVYLGSDLHANPLVVKPVSEIVGKKTLLLTGDYGQRGDDLETSFLVPKISAMAEQVVAVSGNHDSHKLMKSLAAEGVLVLDKDGALQKNGKSLPPTVRDVQDIEIAGVADPLEYKEGSSEKRLMTLEEVSAQDSYKKSWAKKTVEWFSALKKKPNLLMIHQESLALEFAKELHDQGYSNPLTITTGHTHKQNLEKIGSTIVVNSGTIGAGGVFEAGVSGIGLAHLSFNTDGSLRLVEFLLVEPFSGAAQAHRLEVDSLCPKKETCKITIPNELINQSE